ncbi:hypothetical protein NYG90_08535 [Helicobacter sp. XJK30-2]|uniref:Uncharacterized protein n=1 Tax=Helicobacter zhangjianzhongii TaxID=2974574 RepID=A0ACC6FVN1_9HELI|nr:hypothetical protein [Helicobacter sp. XJK30-2]
MIKRKWITKEAALRLLCHADKSARNDRENSPCEKADSRGFRLVSSPLWDSRICDEKAGLRRLLRGDKAGAYRTSKRQAPCFIAQSRIPSKSGF